MSNDRDEPDSYWEKSYRDRQAKEDEWFYEQRREEEDFKFRQKLEKIAQSDFSEELPFSEPDDSTIRDQPRSGSLRDTVAIAAILWVVVALCIKSFLWFPSGSVGFIISAFLIPLWLMIGAIVSSLVVSKGKEDIGEKHQGNQE